MWYSQTLFKTVQFDEDICKSIWWKLSRFNILRSPKLALLRISKQRNVCGDVHLYMDCNSKILESISNCINKGISK